LWHYSGGYWGYKGLIIRDEDLGGDFNDEEVLAKAINEKITFDYTIDADLIKN